MRSLLVLLCVCLATASAEVERKEVVAGGSFDVIVVTFGHEVSECRLTTPHEDTVRFKPEDTSGDKYVLHDDIRLSACAVSVLNVEVGDGGEWTLTAVSSDGTVIEKSESISVLGPDVETEAEDEPSTEGNIYEVTEPPQEGVPIAYIAAETYEGAIGKTVETGIQQVGFRELEKCVVRLPSGDEYDVNDLEAVTGVESYTAGHVYCGVSVRVAREHVGDWLLMATETVWGTAHEERRLPFTIHVEENIEAASSMVTVSEGSDFYLRLAAAVEDPEACSLESPHGGAEDRIQVDESYRSLCGYVVRDVKTDDAGDWNIKYGNDVVYTAQVTLTVTSTVPADQTVVLVRNRPAAVVLGAADAIYCILEDPSSTLVYQGFGQCHLTLERVTLEHEGIWTMKVASPGQVFTQEHTIEVKVSEPEPKTVVTTSVQMEGTTRRILCSMASAHALRSCVFQNHEQVLVSAEGVGENGYKFYGNGSSFVDGVYQLSCGLEYTDHMVGVVWRCAIETEEDTYYGFLTVGSSSDVPVPVLKPRRAVVSHVAGDAAALSCAVAAPLRYCYFRARNGTVYYPVESDTSTPQFEYYGAGLEAGECGIRLSALDVQDSSRWSCHAGLVSGGEELEAEIHVEVKEKLVVKQEMGYAGLMLTAQAWDSHPLEYCRFIRIDGFGFTNKALPSGYTDFSDLKTGFCGIRIRRPISEDLHSWTVVARLAPNHEEITGVTEHTLPQLVPLHRSHSSFIAFYCFVIVFGAALILSGVMMMSRSSREWTSSRASAVRASFRRSFRRDSPPRYSAEHPVYVKGPVPAAEEFNGNTKHVV